MISMTSLDTLSVPVNLKMAVAGVPWVTVTAMSAVPVAVVVWKV
jgi:hypothetical protein